MSSKQEVTEKDWKYLKFFWFLNVIAVGLLITLSFFVPDAEASYHHVAIVGDFEGKFDHKSISADGDFSISNDKHTFTLIGDFEKDGRDMTYNIQCITVVGKLVLDSEETKVYLDFDGKKCKYGYMSFVFGTFETTDSTGKFAGVTGSGRINFYADHHANNVYGTLQGEFKL
jgi:hypothetical protein